jgi:hypothetical protein
MKNFWLVPALALVFIGCRSAAYQVHPGAGGYVAGAVPTQLQLIDSQAYDSLSATDGIIQQTRADYLGNKFPASAMPTIHTAFNATVAAYDSANAAWTAFDAAVKAGSNPSSAAILAAVAGMNQAVSALTAARQGGN